MTVAAEHSVSVAVDLDNKAATGCQVDFQDASGPTSLGGFEVLFHMVVSSNPGSVVVDHSERQDCDGVTGLFGAPVVIDAGPWPVGLDLGAGGAEVVEGHLPLAGSTEPHHRLAFFSTTAAGGEDALLSGPMGYLVFPPLGSIPTLSTWGMLALILLLTGSGLVMLRRRLAPGARIWILALGIAATASSVVLAATIVLDGQIDDWSGVGAFAHDVTSDGTLGDPAADIVSVYVDGGSLFFRIDVRDLEQDPPVAVNDIVVSPEDLPVVIDVLANDSDPDVVDTLTIDSATLGANGTVVLDPNGAILTYTPDLNYFGPDTFSYTIIDGTGLSDSANVNLTITPVNDPPSAVDDEAVTAQAAAVDIDVLANDSDVEGPLTVIGFTQGANGSVTDQGGGVLRYNPMPAHLGPDQFTYQVMDGGGLNAGATVMVEALPPGGPPVIDLNGTQPGRDFGAMFFTGQGPVPIAGPGSIVFDPDGVVQVMQVTITNLLDAPAENLLVDVSGTAITPNFNPGTGVLQLMGPDSSAAFQQVLRTVAYNNGAPLPNQADRIVVFVANDGAGNSNMPASVVLINPGGP